MITGDVDGTIHVRDNDGRRWHGGDDKTSSIKNNDNAWEEQRVKKMHYTAYSLLTYDNMDSRQTTMIWTDEGEQTMDNDDDNGMVVSMPWDQIKACQGSVETENEAKFTDLNIYVVEIVLLCGKLPYVCFALCRSKLSA